MGLLSGYAGVGLQGGRIRRRRRRSVEGGEEQEPLAKRARVSGQWAAREITIGDTTPEALKALLHYLYTDELRFKDEELLDVMRKAREISLDRVCNHCMQQVLQNMSVHDAVAWFLKADEYGLEHVRAAAFGFLACNLAEVKAQVWLVRTSCLHDYRALTFEHLHHTSYQACEMEMLSDKLHLMMQLLLELSRVLEVARAAVA
jgi:hypothetical protein